MTFNFRVFDDEKRALQSKRDRLYTEIENVRAAAGDDPDEGHLEKLERLNAGLAKANEAIRDLEHKGGAELEELMRTHPGSFESGSEPDSRNTRKDRDAVRDVALRCIDRYEDILAPKAGDRLARMVRNDTPRHELSKYVAAVGNPKYDTAFGKALFDPQFGHLRFDAEEVEAVRAVEEARTAMLTSSTGFPLPFALDPSILANSSGALNPVREIARVITITAPTWKGVSSTGVSASYDAEGVEVSDDTPALVQPSITAATGRAFVQFSMEALEDWPGLRQELAQLITDGRDVLDATQFLTGSGTASPGGILNIGGIGGLTTGQRVQSAGSATYATADVYSLVEALAPRYQPRAVFAGSQTIGDKTYRLTPSGSTTEPQLMPTRDGGILGRRLVEWSTMATTTTTGSKVLILGDWSGFVVADRLGMQAELVPHLVGSGARLPLGVRGIFCHWRVGTGVTVPSAFKYLEIL